MSTHVEVIATDLRRTKIKVSPGTYLVDVLREACQKLHISSDKYLLKHKQKQLDLSGPFRTSGLSPGAKLELVAKSSSPSVINIALQFSGRDAAMIPGGRLTGKFPSDFTIWKVLRQFESGGASGGHNLNITARGTAQSNTGAPSASGQLYYESPVLNIMGREFSNLEDFQKTISQCGINSGSVLIRVSFQPTAKTLYEAMQHTSQYLSEVEPGEEKEEDHPPKPASGGSKEEPGGMDVESTSNITPQTAEPTPPTEQKPDQLPIPAPQPAEQHTSIEQTPENMDVDGSATPANTLQPVSVFSAPSGNTPAAALMEDSDSAFTPTLAHAQLHQARLLAGSQNKRLKSDQELEADAAAEAARLAAVRSVMVKVRFPDGTSAQWQFGPDDTGATLFRAVRSVMAHAGQPFKLVMPGAGAHVIRDADGPANTLVKGHGLRGGVLISFVWDEAASQAARTQPFLKSTVAGQAREVVVPEVPSAGPEDDDKAAGPPVGRKEKGGGGAEGMAKKLPKWLKLPGKK